MCPAIQQELECLRKRPQKWQELGPPRQITDAELLPLTSQRLSVAQFARLIGLGRVSVWRRLVRLKAQDLPIPFPLTWRWGGPSRPPRRRRAP